MKKKTTRAGKAAAALATLIAVLACGSHSDILTRDNASRALGAREGAVHWESCTSPLDLVAGATTGDTCGFGNPDTCNGSITCGGCGQSSPCKSQEFACDASHVLRATVTTVLDCEGDLTHWATLPNADPEAFWSSCAEAQASGSTGDSCVGSFQCAASTEDPCCITVARCDSRGFFRYHVCSLNCEAVEPVVQMTTVTSCETANQGVLNAGQPCEGTFICTEGQDISVSEYVPLGGAAISDIVYWCGGGIVQVGTGFIQAHAS